MLQQPNNRLPWEQTSLDDTPDQSHFRFEKFQLESFKFKPLGAKMMIPRKSEPEKSTRTKPQANWMLKRKFLSWNG